MRVTEVKYQRVKSLGNYETERLEMVADVAEGEDHKKVINWLRDEVELILGVDENNLDQGMYN